MASCYRIVSIRISPFCDLARWSLERLGIRYKEVCHAPVFHILFTKLSGGGVNVPVIQASDAVLEGPFFLEYLDSRTRPVDQLYPSAPEQRQEVQDLVSRLYNELAVAVRRYAYAMMLPNARVTARLMTVRAPWWERFLVHTLYPVQAWAMRKALGITPESTEQARKEILSWFETLSRRLQTGQKFLTGDILTAADLTFAAGTSPVILPPEYSAPLPKLSDMPEEMRELIGAVQVTAAGQLALRLYREHRNFGYNADLISPSRDVSLANTVSRWLRRTLSSPALLRPVFSVLRKVSRVWKFRHVALLTRYADVVETLERDQDFTIAEINSAKMQRISGPFILGMDRSEGYEREAMAIRSVFISSDLDRIRAIVRNTARSLIEAARPIGRIDITHNYCGVVAARVVSEYLGVPGPTECILMQWLRALFWDVFQNRNNESAVRRAADRSAIELHDYLETLIVQLENRGAEDTLLGRLVRSKQLDRDGIRRNITGIIVGAVDTTATATVNIVETLLDNADALAKTREAVENGEDNRVRLCCYEALRFRPQTPALLRFSHKAARLRSGASIPGEVTVVLLTLSAMFDALGFPAPKRYSPNRPLDKYLHFGHGMHTCYGKLINGVQIPELVSALVLQPNLRRSGGRFHRQLYEGPYADRFVVSFGANQ